MHFWFQLPRRHLTQWPGMAVHENVLSAVVKEVDQSVKDDDEESAENAEKKPNVH